MRGKAGLGHFVYRVGLQFVCQNQRQPGMWGCLKKSVVSWLWNTGLLRFTTLHTRMCAKCNGSNFTNLEHPVDLQWEFTSIKILFDLQWPRKFLGPQNAKPKFSCAVRGNWFFCDLVQWSIDGQCLMNVPRNRPICLTPCEQLPDIPGGVFRWCTTSCWLVYRRKELGCAGVATVGSDLCGNQRVSSCLLSHSKIFDSSPRNCVSKQFFLHFYGCQSINL